MAHLTKLQRYNIEDSNIALLGSDVRNIPKGLLEPFYSTDICNRLRNGFGNMLATRSPLGRMPGKRYQRKYGE